MTANDSATPTIISRSIARRSFDEVFLTAHGPPAGTSEQAAPAVFAALAARVRALGIQVVAEKIYGARGAHQRLVEQRATAYAAAGLDHAPAPTSLVEGRPIDGEATLAGVQLWGIASRGAAAPRVERVEADGVRGSAIEGAGLRWLYLAAIDAAAHADAGAEAREMFARADRALRQRGFCYAQVARTWIYAARLLDWYDELNRARAEHHGRVGLGHDDVGEVLPASTGIQGAGPAGRECQMDLLAVDGPVTPIRRTSRQDTAFAYGSTFSRGMCVTAEGRSTLYISGTASIDAAGHSSYRDDAEAQCVATLLAVGGLLADHGARPRDLCQATVFCKTPAVYRTFALVTRLLDLPRLPAVYVVADVCRPELLVEIEAIAALPT